jgi:hypothetical protein
MANETVDTRKFQVSPHIIYSLIKAQAGTLAKGVLECVMNSVDAGAANIDIRLDNHTLVVTDDGKGFRTRDEIEACFEVFGFEHIEGERAYGQFGIGRAQLWNFCSTIWHTNSFRMDVDIKNRGLDYDLVENATPVKGLRIEGKFYERLTTSDVLACERELKELAAYVHIPVTFNGERISKEPVNQKWTHETDDAWVALSNVGRTLTVYNLGVKVREYPAYQFGCGGLVVTKPGVRLSLNMARNDILVAECKVWKRIRPFLQGKTDEVIKKASRLTEEQLANLATRFLAGELPYADISARKLVRDVLGGQHTLHEFFDRAWRSHDQTVTYAPKNEAGPAADESHKQGYCFVVSHKTLTRFGVRSLDEFMRKLEQQMAADGVSPVAQRKAPGQAVAQRLTVVEDWKQACSRIAEGFTDIAHKDWTKQEQAGMAALRGVSGMVLRMLQRAGIAERNAAERELRLGVSEVADAWTDGEHVITIERSTLARLDTGSRGAVNAVALLVHEYLHEGNSTGTHVHDNEFHERFHRAMCYFPDDYGYGVGDIVNCVLADYMKQCSKRGVHIKSRVRQDSERLEHFSMAEAA